MNKFQQKNDFSSILTLKNQTVSHKNQISAPSNPNSDKFQQKIDFSKTLTLKNPTFSPKKPKLWQISTKKNNCSNMNERIGHFWLQQSVTSYPCQWINELLCLVMDSVDLYVVRSSTTTSRSSAGWASTTVAPSSVNPPNWWTRRTSTTSRTSVSKVPLFTHSLGIVTNWTIAQTAAGQGCKGERQFDVPDIGVQAERIAHHVGIYFYVDKELLASTNYQFIKFLQKKKI